MASRGSGMPATKKLLKNRAFLRSCPSFQRHLSLWLEVSCVEKNAKNVHFDRTTLLLRRKSKELSSPDRQKQKAGQRRFARCWSCSGGGSGAAPTGHPSRPLVAIALRDIPANHPATHLDSPAPKPPLRTHAGALYAHALRDTLWRRRWQASSRRACCQVSRPEPAKQIGTETGTSVNNCNFRGPGVCFSPIQIQTALRPI